MRRLAALGLLASAAAAFLISNSRVGPGFVYEYVPANRRPVDLLVDTEGAPGLADPVAETQDLMSQWNAVAEAEDVFGTAGAGSAYNGATVGLTFGRFTDAQREVAFDATGDIMSSFGIGPAVLGITLKSVDTNSGQILDVLVVVNTQPPFLVVPGSGATARELIRATLIHELGHAVSLGHSPVGMVNQTTFGLFPAPPQRIPTMYPFRLPQLPQEGQTIEADDVAGLAVVYPAATGGLGSISGTVRSVSGTPLNEILVRAVGPMSGAQHHIGVLTNVDARNEGRFTVPHLPPGDYRVIVEAVNGRGGVDSGSLAGSGNALGADPFIFAADEYWQPGDTYDPAVDDPTDFALVRVRAGRDTGAVDFVANAAPIVENEILSGTLALGDAYVPDGANGFHFADYYAFAGTAGEAATVTATSSDITPQLRLLRPSDLTLAAEHLPVLASRAEITAFQLPESGIYTVVLSARAVTGNPGGTGDYSIALTGAGAALPAPPVVVAASVARGSADPGDQEFASPVCAATLLQVRLNASSHEELWVDRVTVRGSGPGDEARDIATVYLVRDLNGDGLAAAGDPVLATGTFVQDNGAVTLDLLDLEVDAGQSADLLVVYDVVVESVSSAAGFPVWWIGPLAALALLLRPRRRFGLVLLLVVLVPLSCSGSGGGSNCSGPFDPAGAVVAFQATVGAGDILAFTSTSDPAAPLDLVTADLVSGTLSVSN
ncbi:MAG: hypothetical protein ACYTEZ_00590 [Planctomycetota bacterium]|jgi:hypothetical protein